jgi:myo-inositol-1(or 4)-monophosphatase
MFKPSIELATMVDAATVAGKGLMGRLHDRKGLAVHVKRQADFVSEADLESERTLRDMLLGVFPTFGMLAEESAPTGSTAGAGKDRFIVDPLDGTTNFLHGIPHFAIAIALERDGQVVAGLVYDVPKDEMFVADVGRGAWLITGHARHVETGAAEALERLAVSADRDFSRALVATGVPHAGSRIPHETYLPMLANVMREAAGIRRMAAAALDLAYVSAGRVAAFFEFGLAPWDLAAGALLVHEAGGQVTTPTGTPTFMETGNVLATNAALHPAMLAILGTTTRR